MNPTPDASGGVVTAARWFLFRGLWANVYIEPTGDALAEARRGRQVVLLASIGLSLAALASFTLLRQPKVVGIALLVASVVVMPVLARAKRQVGEALGGDPLILADAAETKICVLLSVSTLIGLGAYALTGAAWLDPVAGFVIAAFAVHEGREAWEGELVEDDDDEQDEDDD